MAICLRLKQLLSEGDTFPIRWHMLRYSLDIYVPFIHPMLTTISDPILKPQALATWRLKISVRGSLIERYLRARVIAD